MKFNTDIDIDFADRDSIINHLDVTVAAIRKDDTVKKHNTGVYPTEIPYDPINQISALDYSVAEERGYIKLDLLNVWVYKHVRNEQHLNELMREPDWSKLLDREFFSQLVHIGNHYDTMVAMPEPVDSATRLAMFLSVIRPGKKHLIGLSWKEIAKTIWDKESTGYFFKKSHAISYAHLVIVNMNLLSDNIITSSLQE